MTRKRKLVPVNTREAAEQAFIRTAAQALAGALPVATISGAVLAEASLVMIGWSVLAALLSAGLAGAASYFSIIGGGLPEAYAAHADLPVTPANPSSDGQP